MYFDKRTETVPAPVTHPELEPVQQHLLEAAEYIRRYGWCQASYNCGETVCILGAIGRVVGNYDAPFKRAYYHLHVILHTCPINWNDQRGRTMQEVIDLLERAAGVPPC